MQMILHLAMKQEVVEVPMFMLMMIFFTTALLPSLDQRKIRKCSTGFLFVVNIFLGKEALGCSTSKVLNRLYTYGYKNTESVV